MSKLDDPRQPMAETYRRLRDLSAQMDVPRPSYERVRRQLKQGRMDEPTRAEARKLALELAFNTRAADDVIKDLLALLD
jgi:hypothetical protein